MENHDDNDDNDDDGNAEEKAAAAAAVAAEAAEKAEEELAVATASGSLTVLIRKTIIIVAFVNTVYRRSESKHFHAMKDGRKHRSSPKNSRASY